MGASAAYHLSRRGHRVALLDQYAIPNEWASSGDHARVLRYTYGKDLFYTELAARSAALWKDFQKEIREDLLVPTGVLDIADKDTAYTKASYAGLKQMKIPVFEMDSQELRQTFRVINPRAVRHAVFHPDGGMIWAQRAVAGFTRAASRGRALICPDTKVASVSHGGGKIQEVRDAKGRSWKAEAYVFAAGPWSRDLLAREKLPLTVTRQQTMYFRPPMNQGRFRPGHCPVVFCMARGYYVMPVHIHGFMKIGCHRKGPKMKPCAGCREATPQFERACRDFLKTFIPDVYGFTEAEAKVRYYDNTPDGDFIVDRLPSASNAFVAAGFSGHGFKFAPLIGAALADLITKGRTDMNLARFRLARFRK